MANQTIKYFSNIINNSSEINKKEKDILLKRLRNKDLKTISKKYKVTGERIRQIEEKSLNKFTQKILQLLLVD